MRQRHSSSSEGVCGFFKEFEGSFIWLSAFCHAPNTVAPLERALKPTTWGRRGTGARGGGRGGGDGGAGAKICVKIDVEICVDFSGAGEKMCAEIRGEIFCGHFQVEIASKTKNGNFDANLQANFHVIYSPVPEKILTHFHANFHTSLSEKSGGRKIPPNPMPQISTAGPFPQDPIKEPQDR